MWTITAETLTGSCFSAWETSFSQFLFMPTDLMATVTLFENCFHIVSCNVAVTIITITPVWTDHINTCDAHRERKVKFPLCSLSEFLVNSLLWADNIKQDIC